VFISNAWEDNELALRVTDRLNTYNIDYFHYQYRNTIPVATIWHDRLLAKVDDSRIFVQLLSEPYRKSEWCQKEFVRAEQLRRIGRLTMIPYFLHRLTGAGSALTGQAAEADSRRARAGASRPTPRCPRPRAR
jgi:hypothetical protein